jgi:hypothetical protein
MNGTSPTRVWALFGHRKPVESVNNQNRWHLILKGTTPPLFWGLNNRVPLILHYRWVLKNRVLPVQRCPFNYRVPDLTRNGYTPNLRKHV